MNQTQIRYILAAGWGVYAGAIAGYVLSKRKWKTFADEEIESVKSYYYDRQATILRENLRAVEYELYEEAPIRASSGPREFIKPGEPVNEFEELEKEAAELAQDLKYVDLDTVDPEEIEPNVVFEPDSFEESVPVGHKYPRTEVEDPSRPYVISVDEFMEDEPEHDKVTLTYYEADDILADDNGKVLRSLDKVIGDQAILHFGERSSDSDLVYVRNEWLASDYEVTRDPRSYQEVVLKLSNPTRKSRKIPEDE